MIAGNLTKHSPPAKHLKLGLLDRCARSFLYGLLSRLQEGQISVVGDGRQTFGSDSTARSLRATIDVRDPGFYRTIAGGGGIGAGEAYFRGQWDCDDLTGLIRILLRNRQALAGLQRLSDCWRAPAQRLWHAWRRNSKRGSRENIAAHYDLGNDFFALFLDETLSYSCGVFPAPGASLAEASVEKNDQVCRKLQLSPQDHVLEIGSGWGGLALHAASRYGCRVTTTTISQAQCDLVRQRVRVAGLEDRVTVLRSDYRELRGQYDKLVSIEMIEAVGYKYLDEYFRCCRRLLKPAGLLLLQAILMSERNFDAYRRSVDFIQRYIFPGGFLPSLGAITGSVARATDFGLLRYEDITHHYPPMLRGWRDQFRERVESFRELGYPESFQRMWEFYFCYCEAAFLERHVTCAHLMLGGPRVDLHHSVDGERRFGGANR